MDLRDPMQPEKMSRMSDAENTAPAAEAHAAQQPRIDSGYTNVVSIAMDAKKAAESSASKDDVETLRQQLAEQRELMSEKIALAVAAERERVQELEREIKTEKVLGQALADVPEDYRRTAEFIARHSGVDVLGEDAAAAVAAFVREQMPQAFAVAEPEAQAPAQPAAPQPPIPSKPVAPEIDISGKTWETMTREEIAAIKDRPDLVRQLNDAGSPYQQPRIGQIRKKD